MFVDHDMRGRSDKVHLTLGRYALSRDDYQGAQKELRLALDELRHPGDRTRTAALLARMPHMVPDVDQIP